MHPIHIESTQVLTVQNPSVQSILLTDLPLDLMKNCFSYLTPFNLMTLANVCKKLNIALEKSVAWPNQSLELVNNMPSFLSMCMKFVLAAKNDLKCADEYYHFDTDRYGFKKGPGVFDIKRSNYKFKLINCVEVAKKLSERNSLFFTMVDENLKNDRYFASEVCKANIDCFAFVGEGLKKDRAFVSQCCKINMSCFKFVDECLRGDKDFVYEMLYQAAKDTADRTIIVSNIGKKLGADKKFIWSLRKIPGYLSQASVEIKLDSRFKYFEALEGRYSYGINGYMSYILERLNAEQKSKMIQDIENDL